MPGHGEEMEIPLWCFAPRSEPAFVDVAVAMCFLRQVEHFES